MTLPLLVLFQSFIFIFGVLGLRFFRKAKHNFMWVLSALPFAIDSGLLITYYLRPSALPDFVLAPGYELPRALATLLCVVAIALYMFTLGTHREALPGWHQPQDQPSALVTWGPYRQIRHPFYSSYVLFFTGSLLLAPAWPLRLNSIYLFGIINLTAAREERALAAAFPDYANYIGRTGRFFPRLLGRRSASGAATA